MKQARYLTDKEKERAIKTHCRWMEKGEQSVPADYSGAPIARWAEQHRSFRGRRHALRRTQH